MNIGELKTGNLLLVHNKWMWTKPDTWLSAINRLFQGCYWNHMSGIIVDNTGTYVVEMVGSGYLETPIQEWLDYRRRDIWILPNYVCEPGQIRVYRGTKYDTMSFMLFCVIYLLAKVWVGRKYAKAAKRLYCSEIFAYVYHLPKPWKKLPRDFATMNGVEIKKKAIDFTKVAKS